MGRLIVRRFLLVVLQLVGLSLVLFFLMYPREGYQWVVLEYYPYFEIAPISFNFQEFFSDYSHWLGNILRGDFGWSWSFQMPVVEIIGRRLPHTLRLLTVTLLIIYGVGVPLGVVGGKYPGSFRDRIVLMVTQIGSSFPSFTMSYILMIFLVFGVIFGIRWFPLSGSLPLGVYRENGLIQYELARLRHVILPALSLALVQLVIPVKYLRSGILETIKLPFITTARAKGVKKKDIFKRHIFKNSLPPIIATFPMQLIAIISGMIIVERVFVFPGIGQLIFLSFQMGDLAVVIVLTLMLVTTVLLLNIVADVLIMKLDPRVEFEKK